MSGSGSLWSDPHENSTISNITNYDDDENRDLGIASLIMLITLCCFVFVLICCFCFIFCEDCCKHHTLITRNYNNYSFSRSSSSSSYGSDHDIESGNEIELKKIVTPLSVKNESFLTMNELSKFQYAEETCPICLETFDESNEHSRVIQTECGHLFHLDCIKHESVVTCPMCREPFKASHYFDLFVEL